MEVGGPSRPRLRRLVQALLGGAFVLAGLAVLTPPAAASVNPVGEGLPFHVAYGASMWDGKDAYIMGGWQVPSDHAEDPPYAYASSTSTIVKIDGSTFETTALNVSLNLKLRNLHAATIHKMGYMVGGQLTRSFTGKVDRFDPATRTVAPVTFIDRARTGAAVWSDGIDLFFAGGMTSAGPTDEIYRVDVLGGTTATIGHLPTPVAYAAGAYVDGNGYLFGGVNGTGVTDRVVKVFASGVSEYVNIRLPSPRANATATVDGPRVYIFGGQAKNGMTGQILRFAAPDSMTLQCDRLPTGRSGVMAEAIGTQTVLVMGGHAGLALSNQTLIYRDGPCPPPPQMTGEIQWEVDGTCQALIHMTGVATGEEPFSYAWDLGDGFTASGETVDHKYSKIGYYTVTVRIEGDDFRQVLAKQVIHVDRLYCPDVPAPTSSSSGSSSSTDTTESSSSSSSTPPSSSSKPPTSSSDKPSSSSSSPPVSSSSKAPGSSSSSPATGNASSPSSSTKTSPIGSLGMLSTFVLVGALVRARRKLE